MNVKPYAIVTGILFSIMAAAQAARFFLRWAVTLNGHVVPRWPSAVACLVLVALARWGFHLARRANA